MIVATHALGIFNTGTARLLRSGSAELRTAEHYRLKPSKIHFLEKISSIIIKRKILSPKIVALGLDAVDEHCLRSDPHFAFFDMFRAGRRRFDAAPSRCDCRTIERF